MLRPGFLFDNSSPLFKLHIHQWAENYKPSCGLATAAQQLAVIAEPLHYIAHVLRDRRADHLLPPRPSAKDWMRLYRSHGSALDVLSGLFPTPLGNGRQTRETLSIFRGVRRWAKQNPAEVNAWAQSIEPQSWLKFLRHAFRVAWRQYRQNLRSIREMLKDEDKADDEFEQALWHKPEVHFFLAVTLPCICKYEMMPIALLRWARAEAHEGKTDRFIEKLIRLDAMAVNDPLIERWQNKCPGDERRRKIDLVSLWSRQGTGGQLSMQGIKQSMAGLIAIFAKGLNIAYTWKGKHKVNIQSGAILELFDAVARDRGKGFGAKGVDKDLYDLEPESWRQAVSKKRKAWLTGLPLTVRKTFEE